MTMHKDPALRIQDYQVFGEFGGVNASISDSATYTFMTTEKMAQCFGEELEGCFLYSRHMSPSNLNLSTALAAMEGTEAAQVMASGMGAITSCLMQLAKNGDEIISSRTIYGRYLCFLEEFPSSIWL